MTAYGHVGTGYEYPLLKFTVISETDIFGKVKKKRRHRTYEGRKIQDLPSSNPGTMWSMRTTGLASTGGSRRSRWIRWPKTT